MLKTDLKCSRVARFWAPAHTAMLGRYRLSVPKFTSSQPTTGWKSGSSVSTSRVLPLPARPGPANRINVPLPYVSPSLRSFLADEAGGALLLLSAAVIGLVWANIPGGGYETVWTTPTLVEIGNASVALDLRHWVNDAAMSIFFLVVGLEISREVTVGELHSVRSVVIPASTCGAHHVAPSTSAQRSIAARQPRVWKPLTSTVAITDSAAASSSASLERTWL